MEGTRVVAALVLSAAHRFMVCVVPRFGNCDAPGRAQQKQQAAHMTQPMAQRVASSGKICDHMLPRMAGCASSRCSSTTRRRSEAKPCALRRCDASRMCGRRRTKSWCHFCRSITHHTMAAKSMCTLSVREAHDWVLRRHVTIGCCARCTALLPWRLPQPMSRWLAAATSTAGATGITMHELMTHKQPWVSPPPPSCSNCHSVHDRVFLA